MKPPIIISEVGNCHEGNINAALEMLEKSKECGADLVKFQAGLAENFARKHEDIPRYKKYELGLHGYNRILARGREIGIPVFFSVWSDVFKDYWNLEWTKIPARQCNYNVIGRYANEKTFISIPHLMPDHEVFSLGITHGIIMHCVEKYPAHNPFLNRMLRLKEMFCMDTGYSDHTIGIDSCIKAVEFGAYAIEKHFTLAHDFGPLRDHIHAATPEEFKTFVEKVRG